MAAITLICKLVYRIVPYEPLIDSRMPSSLNVAYTVAEQIVELEEPCTSLKLLEWRQDFVRPGVSRRCDTKV